MADFQTAYHLVADAEGGYQRHPNDTGNYNSRNELVGTNWGISAPVYENWINQPPTEADMRNMPAATARSIYKTRFWDDIRGDEIRSQAVANIFFDGRVNHGRTGTKIMQRVLKIPADGVVGPQTLQAINRANPEQLYIAYREARRAFYYELAERSPSLSVFLQGWFNRLATFNEYTGGAVAIGGGAIIALVIVYLISDLKTY
jgi:lysozyme family protein